MDGSVMVMHRLKGGLRDGSCMVVYALAENGTLDGVDVYR